MKASTFWIVPLGLGLLLADVPDHQPPGGLSLMNEAHAIVGRPLTPLSVAGVARRTTRRVIVATSMYVPRLPPSCSVVVIEGTTLHLCGSTYYRASGAQYVVVNVQ